MKLSQLLFEKISPVVYHATQFENAIKILQDDHLRSRTGYVSTARSLTGSYPTENKMIGVIFELDGNLLNQKYAGKAVGTEDYDLYDNLTYSGKRNKQLEDRIITHKKGIANFTQYIIKAHIFIPLEYMEDNHKDEFDHAYSEGLGQVKNIVSFFESNDIPYRVVFSEKDLVNKRVDDRDKLDSVLNPDEDETEYFVVTLGKYDDIPDEEFEMGMPEPTEVKRFKIKGLSIPDVEDRVERKLSKKSEWVLIDVDYMD